MRCATARPSVRRASAPFRIPRGALLVPVAAIAAAAGCPARSADGAAYDGVAAERRRWTPASARALAADIACHRSDHHGDWGGRRPVYAGCRQHARGPGPACLAVGPRRRARTFSTSWVRCAAALARRAVTHRAPRVIGSPGWSRRSRRPSPATDDGRRGADRGRAVRQPVQRTLGRPELLAEADPAPASTDSLEATIDEPEWRNSFAKAGDIGLAAGDTRLHQSLRGRGHGSPAGQQDFR